MIQHTIIVAALWTVLIVGGIAFGRWQARWERSVFVREHPDEKPPGDPVWFPDHVHIINTGDYPIIQAEGTQEGAPKRLRVGEINPNLLCWVDVNGDSVKMRIRLIEVGGYGWRWFAEDEASLKRRYVVQQ